MFDINILSCISIDTSEIGEVVIEDETNDMVSIMVKTRPVEKFCPGCGCSTSKVKDYYSKTYTYYGVGLKTILIHFKQRRYVCPNCGKSFIEKNPFNKSKNYKLTKNLRIEIIKHLKEVITCSAISRLLNISTTPIMQVLEEVEPKSGNFGTIVCMDEFSRIKIKGKLYYSAILINGDDGSLIDVLPSRKKANIIEFLEKSGRNNLQKIKYLSIDMWSPYAEAFRELIPEITVVVDKFHFIRYLTSAIDKVRIRVMKTFDKDSLEYHMLKSNGYRLLKKDVDRSHYLIKFRHNKMLLSMYEYDLIEKMNAMSNDLKYTYNFLHSTLINYDDWTYEVAKTKIKSLIDSLRLHNEISELTDLANIYENWYEEICNSFLICNGKKINNAICEGVNSKIKGLKKISAGIVNFNHLRNRIFLIYRNYDPEKK